LNKLKLIQTLKDRCDLTKDEANKVVRTFFSEMTNAMIYAYPIDTGWHFWQCAADCRPCGIANRQTFTKDHRLPGPWK
jgi:hypothetical protein